MTRSYNLLFKTAQSEFRTWSNLLEGERKSLSLIVELTRGRKIRGSGVHPDGSEYDHEELRNEYGIYGFERHKDWLRENLHDHPGYTLDLTRESGLECREVIDLKSPANGYENWCNFCRKLRDEGHQIFPVVQSYPTEDDTEQSYSENIQSQFRNLCEFSDSVVYRASVLKDSEFFLDIIILREQIEEYVARGGKFVVVMDHEFIRTGTAILHALRTAGFIANLRTIISSCEIVVIGTSFPRDVEELGDPDQGSFRTEETFLYDEILRLTNDPVGIHYGDYGSINPERFDGITRGWRPRIDYPARDRRIFYHREKRENKSYSTHYKSVAKKIAGEEEFRTDTIRCWGRDMVFQAASGEVPGSSPSFWTSVRMNIFIHQQFRRLRNEATRHGYLF